MGLLAYIPDTASNGFVFSNFVNLERPDGLIKGPHTDEFVQCKLDKAELVWSL